MLSCQMPKVYRAPPFESALLKLNVVPVMLDTKGWGIRVGSV